MTPQETGQLANLIRTWLTSLHCLNIRETLGENELLLELLEDKCCTANGINCYFLSGDAPGIWRTYKPGPLASLQGSAHELSEPATAEQLASAAAKNGCCCKESFMYGLLTIEDSKVADHSIPKQASA